jgi:hypothetical protein
MDNDLTLEIMEVTCVHFSMDFCFHVCMLLFQDGGVFLSCKFVIV